MKPYIHSLSSVKKWRGTIENYLPIHEFMDSTKSGLADNRHRCILHTSQGIFIVEKVFGSTITNSDGKVVSVRDVAENHIKEDFGGFIPTLQDFLEHMIYQTWMHGEGMPSSCRNLHLNIVKKVTKWKVD